MSFDLEVTGKVLAAAGEGLSITSDTLVRMRALGRRHVGQRSTRRFFTLEGSELASSSNVVVSEIHYNPRGEENLEFVELRNTTDKEVILAGAAFTDGIEFTFPVGSRVAAQGCGRYCRRRAGLRGRLPGSRVSPVSRGHSGGRPVYWKRFAIVGRDFS